ncbi:S-adenosyl-L-methionine-dependent methyltransferase [Peziza echinospora]|nr:S-adenosyl-L-methionine-dependent methyltransferase [Peziza echinospora]
MATSTPIASAALTGFSLSSAYDTHRPSYPPHIVEHLLSNANLLGKAGAHIIDLGAGTGKFTELLAAREEGYVVRAADPHPDMRRVLEEKKLKGVDVFARGADEKVPDWESWADGVIVAQAFHWFSTPQAIAAIHSHLRPNGTLSLIWNVEDYNQFPSHTCLTTWESHLRDLLWGVQDGLPRYRNSLWQKPLSETELFETPYHETIFPQATWVKDGKEGLWRRIGTLSYVRALETSGGEEWREFRRKFDEILGMEGVRWGDDGEVEIHLITHVVWTRRVD